MATVELVREHAEVAERAWALPAQIPELDGIRGLAILLVLACHSTMWLPASGFRDICEQGKVGVDLFFVLSGFLITGILLDSRKQAGALPTFYIRRALRIWPLYFSYLTISFLMFGRMMPVHFSRWAYVLFAQNFFYWISMGPFLDPTWSLAVEEQFYVVWPWIALRVRRERVLKICCAVLGMAPVIRLAFRLAGAGPAFIYGNTLCRLDGIAMGGMLAAWVRDARFEVAGLKRLARVGLVAGIVGVGGCCAGMPFGLELRYSFVTLAFAGVFAFTLLTQGTESPLARMLRSSALTGLGRISFALYLFNLPIYGMVHGHAAGRVVAELPYAIAEFIRTAAATSLLWASATLSWRMFESRLLRLKDRWAPQPAELKLM